MKSAELPLPVARYLRRALPQDGPAIRQARFLQSGTLRTDTRRNRWFSFEATHVVIPPATRFMWSAKVRLAPLLHIGVQDALVNGKGSGRVSFLSAFTISSAGDTPEMNSGSLHRFLAEAVWYPTALLPGGNLQWSPIDDYRATAALSDAHSTVSLEFTFAESGEVTGIYTSARWGMFEGTFKQRAWEGHFRNYEEHNRMLVPAEADVGWYIDGRWEPVWRGRILDFQYELQT